MLPRFQVLWSRTRDSLWFLPAVLTLLAVVLAVVLVQVDRGVAPEWIRSQPLLFGGGAEGARGVLSAIAGSLITVTGVVFSVTVVALQLASSQFTPRVLRGFTADRVNQVVLGILIGTFTYTLLVLRTVRVAEEQNPAFVPSVSVTTAVVLVLLSIAALIVFINHAARSIQAEVILTRAADDTMERIEALFPERVGHPEPADLSVPPAEEALPVTARKAGYLQAVDPDALFQVGREQQLLIRMEPHIGDFLLPGEALARVWPAGRVTDEVTAEIRRAFVLGSERTPHQDVEYGLIEISDIAVKALSPGINDPTTALRAIDRLAETLLALGTRWPPRDQRTREDRIHFVAKHLHFERAVHLALDPILHAGASDPAIVKKLLAVLVRLESLLPDARRSVVQREQDRVRQRAEQHVDSPSEREELEALERRLARDM